MKTFLIAAIAVAVSGAAFAKDLKGTVMTDSEMDRVTAAVTPDTSGQGALTALSAGGAVTNILYNRTSTAVTAGGLGQNGNIPGTIHLLKTCTANRTNCCLSS